MVSVLPQYSSGKIDPSQLNLNERVVFTRRIAKVVKGGRHLRFNALVIVGNGEGVVGAGLGKALAIPDAVRKGNARARKNLIKIPLKGSTIPQETSSQKGASRVLIKPAPSRHRHHRSGGNPGSAGLGRGKRRCSQVPGLPQPHQRTLRHPGCSAKTKRPRRRDSSSQGTAKARKVNISKR